MTRGRRRELLEKKFKRRLKYWANVGYCVRVNGEWRKATTWDQLKDHHEFRDQFECYRDKWKEYNYKHRKKVAFQRMREQLEEINSPVYDEYDPFYHYNLIRFKSRFSDVKDKTYGI